MTKREKKIQVVKQMLSSCVTSSTSAFSFGNIPRNRFDGAKRNYAYDAKYDEVLALIDTTVFGGGERGMIITEHDVYLKEILSSPEHCKLSNIGGLTVPGETYYNRNNLCEMLAKLEEIENEPEYGFWDTLGDIVGTVIDESAKSIQKEYKKLMAESEQEALELLVGIRNSLETLRDDVINEWIEEYYDLEEDEVAESIKLITSFSCLFTNDIDRYKKIQSIDENENLGDFIEQCIESMNMLTDQFDKVCDEEVDESIEPLSRTFKRFNAGMVRIYGDMLNDLENGDMEGWELPYYYNQTQEAVETLKRKINVLVTCLNRKIEEAYDD